MVTPILASDTTIVAVKALVYLFFIGVAGGTMPGVFSLGVFCFSRARHQWKVAAVALGLISMGVGLASLTFILVFTAKTEFLGWAAASTPLAIGILAVILWTVRVKNERHVV